MGAPSLADVIRAGIHSAAADLHVSIPATVVRVELGRGLVDAQPLVKDIFEGQAASVPVITNVPIVWPGAGGFRLTFPIAVDDVVLLVFSDRSLDLWLEKGGEVDPKDPRRHALSDAIAIPGLRSFNAPWSGAAADGVTLGKDGAAIVKITGSDVTVTLGPAASPQVQVTPTGVTFGLGGLTLGMPGGAPQPAALGTAVRTELDALWTALQAHTHPATCTGGTTAVSAPSVTKDAQTVEASALTLLEPQ